MERYELIKEYPGSPEKGTIVFSPHREKAYQDPESKYKTRNSRNVRIHIFYSADYIEKWPKFWKKIQ